MRVPAAGWLGFAATLVTAMMVTGWAAHPAAQISVPAATMSRIDRLTAWIDAVKRHQPGAFDDAATEISQWGGEELNQIWVDLSSVITLLYEPNTPVLYTPQIRRGSGPPPIRTSGRVPYTAKQQEQLRLVAKSLGPRGDGHDSRLLKRGAMLHADIAMLAPQEVRATGVDGPVRYRLETGDGRALNFYASVSHWDMGRRILDRVRFQEKRDGPYRGPEHDEGVRIWYLAGMSHMIRTGDFDFVQFETANRLFPNDPEVLFMCASFNEVYAGADRQIAFRSAKLPGRVTFGVGSRTEQLIRAEQLYRRVLDTAPESSDEARIRYARVLGQRGRHLAAVTELQKVRPTDPLLEYYAALFLGGELEALGQDEEARRAYERAVEMFPGAQSPRLGLSRLATGAERANTHQALLTLLEQPVDGDAREDPFWTYESAPGRNTSLILKWLHLLLAREGL